MGHRSLLAARPDGVLAQRAAARGIEIVPCEPRFQFDPFTAAALRRRMRQDSVDIIHAHTGYTVAQAALAKRGTTAHMVISRRVDIQLRSNPATRWKYAAADRFIAISGAVAQSLTRSGIDSALIDIIPSGIDLSRRILPASSTRLAQLGVPHDAQLIVQVGQLVPAKDPLTFVRAIDIVRRVNPRVFGLLVGGGPLHGAVRAEISALDASGHVAAPGHCTDPDELLAAADVCTLTSQQEGLGSVLLDALSLGKPIVATAVGGIPETVPHDVCGLLADVHDHAQIAAHLATLLGDESTAARMSRAARERSLQYSVAVTARRTAEVYQRLVGLPGT